MDLVGKVMSLFFNTLSREEEVDQSNVNILSRRGRREKMAVVETDVELGALQLRVKECQELQAAARGWERRGGAFPLSLQRECGPAYAFDFWPPAVVCVGFRKTVFLSCGRFGMEKVAHWCGCFRNCGEIQALVWLHLHCGAGW